MRETAAGAASGDRGGFCRQIFPALNRAGFFLAPNKNSDMRFCFFYYARKAIKAILIKIKAIKVNYIVDINCYIAYIKSGKGKQNN